LGSSGDSDWKKSHWQQMVFKKKLNAEGKVEKYKPRLIEKGYSHVEGIDFGDIFSSVAKLTSIIFFYLFLLHLILK
jgi:hypothetical protein